jgi:hypothetical protein
MLLKHEPSVTLLSAMLLFHAKQITLGADASPPTNAHTISSPGKRGKGIGDPYVTCDTNTSHGLKALRQL